MREAWGLGRRSGGTHEPWRAAVTRWGDQLWGQALLFTNQRAAAEQALVDAFCHVFGGVPPVDAELALYAALAARRRRRWLPVRDRILSRRLSRVAPQERLLLGLWLVREANGTRLAEVARLAPAAIVSRLLAVLDRDSGRKHRSSGPDCNAARTAWLRSRLALPVETDEHAAVCEACQLAIAGYEATLSDFGAELRAVAAHQTLPETCAGAIEVCVAERRNAPAPVWWKERRTLQAALVVAIVFVIAVLVLPGKRPAEETAAPPDARALVQTALESWTTPPQDGTIYHRVRAIDLLTPDRQPLVTDVWLAPDGPRHRFEVRSGNRLVEWQIADGSEHLYYGVESGSSSCPWKPEALGLPASDPLEFSVAPAEQAAARDARLLQGAYATGYVALQDAMDAPDLRSFGARRENGRTFAVLSYTSLRLQPVQQILLLIDPVEQQLHAVQALATEGAQTTPRDLWRLQSAEQPTTGVPIWLPKWSEGQPRDRILDPACPLLEPDQILSLRSLVGRPWQEWYLPRTLPATLTRGAVISMIPSGETSEPIRPNDSSVVLIGPGRWLRLSAGEWAPNVDAPADFQRGAWRVDLIDAGRPGAWNATLRRTQDGLTVGEEEAPGFRKPESAFVPTVDLSAIGWTRDELLELVDSLAVVDAASWMQLKGQFLDPAPLDIPIAEAFDRAFGALAPQPNHTVYTRGEMTLRTYQPQPTLHDPYHLAEAMRYPETIQREQWLVYEGTTVARFRELETLSDGALYRALLHDGARVTLDFRAEGWRGTDEPARHSTTRAPEQLEIEMVAALLGTTGSLNLREEEDGWAIESSRRGAWITLYSEFLGRELPVPWIGGLYDGEIVRRLVLDRATYLPRRLEILHRDLLKRETLLQRTVITDRRIEEGEPAFQELPASPADTLHFNATASQWRRARAAFPRLSSHWLNSSFDSAGLSVLVDAGEGVSPLTRILQWQEGIGPERNWTLQPALSLPQLSIGALQANTWHDLAELPPAHRAQYRMAPGFVLLRMTQGPRGLVEHILRYSPPLEARGGPSWTSSSRVPVAIEGASREAWLLEDGEFAALVVEVDEVMLHFTGPRDYLTGPLLELLPQLEWTPLD